MLIEELYCRGKVPVLSMCRELVRSCGLGCCNFLGSAELMESSLALRPQLFWMAIAFQYRKIATTLKIFSFLKKKPKLAEDDEDDDEDDDDDDEYVFLF